jgi:hypothetical protein
MTWGGFGTRAADPGYWRTVGGDVSSFVDSHLTPGAGSFLAHAVGLLLAVALAGFLYHRKIFLRV